MDATEDGVKIMMSAFLDKPGSAGRDVLLRRLEEDPCYSRQVIEGREGPGDADADRSVRVMTARVHETVYLRSVRRTSLLLDGQGIDVRSKADDRITRSDFDQEPDSVRANPGIEAVLLESFGDPIGGSALRPSDLGVAVQVTSHSDGVGCNGTRMGGYTSGEIGHRTGLYGFVALAFSTLRGQEGS